MHLRKSDDTIRSGLPLDVESKNGMRETQHQNGTHVDRDASSHDTIEISIEEQELDMVLHTLLASWILLVQRYQRDSFHRFTWGLGQSGQDFTQCIESELLDASKPERADELLAMVQSAISKEAPRTTSSSVVYFNDGTTDEVSLDQRRSTSCLLIGTPVDFCSQCRNPNAKVACHFSMAASYNGIVPSRSSVALLCVHRQ